MTNEFDFAHKNMKVYIRNVYFRIFKINNMNYTAIPSIKGQITIPPTLRKKYGICKETPVIISDNNNGTITLKVMKMVDHDDIVYREDKNGTGLSFKNGVSPQVLIDAINDIDG